MMKETVSDGCFVFILVALIDLKINFHEEEMVKVFPSFLLLFTQSKEVQKL
jgi:hypothetical protein